MAGRRGRRNYGYDYPLTNPYPYPFPSQPKVDEMSDIQRTNLAATEEMRQDHELANRLGIPIGQLWSQGGPQTFKDMLTTKATATAPQEQKAATGDFWRGMGEQIGPQTETTINAPVERTANVAPVNPNFRQEWWQSSQFAGAGQPNTTKFLPTPPPEPVTTPVYTNMNTITRPALDLSKPENFNSLMTSAAMAGQPEAMKTLSEMQNKASEVQKRTWEQNRPQPQNDKLSLVMRPLGEQYGKWDDTKSVVENIMNIKNSLPMATQERADFDQKFQQAYKQVYGGSSKETLGNSGMTEEAVRKRLSAIQPRKPTSAEAFQYGKNYVPTFTSEQEAERNYLTSLLPKGEGQVTPSANAPQETPTQSQSFYQGTSPVSLSGKPAGRYRVNGSVVKWDGSRVIP